MEKLNAMLNYLVDKRPYIPASFPSVYERLLNKYATRLLKFSGATLAILVVMALVNITLGLNDFWKLIALILGVGAQGLALLSMVLQPLSVLPEVFYFNKRNLSNFVHEVNHDEQIVAELISYPKDSLECALYWLTVKIDRIERRVKAFVGDKTAVLSLVILAGTLLKDAGALGLIGLDFRMKEGSYIHMLIYWLFSFLLGGAIGALIYKSAGERLRYYRELVQAALDRQAIQVNSI